MRGTTKSSAKTSSSSSSSSSSSRSGSSGSKVMQQIHKQAASGGLFEGVQLSSLKRVPSASASASSSPIVDTQSFTSDGYVFQYLNYGQVCSDMPVAIVGLTINACLSDEGGNSFMYTCNEGFAMKTKYVGSSNCYGNSDSMQYPLGCTTEFNDDDYSGEAYVSLYVGCSVDDSTLQIPDGMDYAVSTYFGDSTCSGTMAYKGLMDGMCIPSGTDGSFIVNFPNITTYSGVSNCVGGTKSSEKLFQTSCGPSSQASFDDDTMPNFGFENGALMTGTTSINPTTNDDDNAPAPGAVAGVVIGCVVGVGLLFGLLFWAVFFRKPSKSLSAQEK